MATRKTKRKPTNGKTPVASKKNSSRRTHKKSRGGGILWLLLILILVAGGIVAAINIKELYQEEIMEGISIDGLDVSGMTKEAAYQVVETAADEKLKNISITFRYNDKEWKFTAEDLQAKIVVEGAVETAYETGKSDSVIDRFKTYQEISSDGLTLKTEFLVDRQVLVNALADVKAEIDQPMIEPSINFDPTDYDFFEDKANPDVDMSKDMFTITEGKVGYAMDYDKALQALNDQLEDGWTADIDLTVKESYPTLSKEVLEECTTLVYHASSPISSSNRKITERNHNIEKAISFYKGMVVMPGEIVSYNDVLGERTEEAGWLPAPTIARDKSVRDELGGGICQAASTIFNAAFRAGAKIIESQPHSWRAYFDPFGYAMDAMINYGTSDMIFQNNSEYPMFFNTYFWFFPGSTTPGYVDVDVYTMPQKDENGNILHIFPEATEIRKEDPPPMVYEEIDEATALLKFPTATWTPDPTLNKLVYLHISPRYLYEYSVDRVWYKDCDEIEPGIWDGGTEVKREYSHTYLYKNVAGLTYTKPMPVVPTPAPATPSPEPTPDGGATG